jgi:hypothetical protein
VKARFLAQGVAFNAALARGYCFDRYGSLAPGKRYGDEAIVRRDGA